MEYRAGAGVILASGGFEWNRELWDSLVGLPWEGPGSPPDNEGDGLIMAAKIGAKLGNLDKAIWRPARYLGEKYDERPYMRMAMYYGAAPGEIIVNRAGRRFTNEGLNYNDICRVMTAFDPNTYEFPNDPCFVVGDNRVRSRAAGFDAEAGDGVDDRDQWHEAGTLKELAGKLGIDPSGLEAQIEEFNRYATEGTDPVFHRGSKPWDTHFHMVGASGRAIAPIVAPPFVGYRVRAGVFGTRGGPVTDENAQILDVDDRPISGLYGAGNVVASPFASAYPGGGATLGPAVTFGHVAGKALVESAAAATYGR
jgi:3-oxosteroid 1-dehydrogenase